MIAVGLIALLGVTPVTDKLANFRGQPVLAIEIDLPEEEDAEFIRSLIDIQPGYLLSTRQLQSAIKRIYALGRFSNVEVRAQRISGVVLLHFRLRPVQRLDYLEIEGLNWAEEDPLRAALKMRLGAEVDRRTPELMKQRAEQHLADVGFPNARVTVEAEESEADAVERSFSMRVLEAVPRRVAAIRFTGAPRVHASVLGQIIKTEVGDILNQKRLALDRKRLAHAYVDHGFLRSRVDEPQIQSVDGTDTVIFNIDAGDRIQLEFTGQRSVTEDDLRTLWPEETQRIERGSLTAFATAITNHYLRRGYADAEVEVRGYRDADSGITRYLFIISEGQPIRVTGIDFVGAEAITAATLAEQVRAVLVNELREGADFQQIARAELETVAFGMPEYGQHPQSAGYLIRYPPEERWVPELYERALDGILAVYKDRGYLEAELGEPVLKRAGDQLRVEIQVREGPQTFIESVSFEGNQTLSALELIDELELTTGLEEGTTKVTPGGPFSASGIETGRIALVRRFRDLGYLYARIFTDATPAEEASIAAEVDHANVTFRIEEGPQVRIRNILVRGNRHTDTDTIRSQISLERGDIYRLDQAVRDQRAISRLGVFESVRVKLIDEERPEEQKDLVAEVVERKRQSFEPFFGLSTADGVRVGAAYSHNNLFGYAASLNLEARFNRQFFFEVYGLDKVSMQQRYDAYTPVEHFTKGIERTLRAGVRSRRFSIGPLGTALRVDFTNEMDQAVNYSAHETALTAGVEVFALPAGGSAELGDQLPGVQSDRLTFALEPRIAYTDAECPDDTGSCHVGQDAATVIPEGERVAFQIGPTLTFDYRDDQFRPTSGFWIKGSSTYAIGEVRQPESYVWWNAAGDQWLKASQKVVRPFSYLKVEATVIGYLPFFGAVLVLTGQAGHIASINGKIPIDDRFYLGGRETMRGFGQDRMIADDACIGTGPQLLDCPETISATAPETTGGNTFFLLRTELRIDITESISIGIFADVGNLWIKLEQVDTFRPRIGVGAGLRYNTAVGALVLDLGFNPDPRPWEPVFEPHFSVSRF